jgi:small GTP-binding protein
MDNNKLKEIKTILVGRSGTGKTNLINAITGQKFSINEASTIASSFVEKKITKKNKDYLLAIWDTAGQEKYRALTKIFIKDSKIVIFVYSIDNRKSFEEIDYWVETVKTILGDKPVFGLAGNKIDLFQVEQVTAEEGKNKAKEIGAIFKSTSAKTKVGINEFIEKLVEEYAKKEGDISDDNKSAKLSSRKFKEKNNSKCCK